MAYVTVTGHIFDPTGTAINNGTVKFRLSNYLTIPRVSGTNIIVPTEQDVTSNSAGFFTITLEGNDGITPAGTIYEVNFGDGEWIRYKFTGTGTINLDSFGPLQSPPTGTIATVVTSVGLSLPSSVFTITNSPITGSGTITGTFNNQNANTVFAGPASGAAGTPSFRALVAADISGIGDGLIHGDSISWIDPGFIWWRDDFLQPSLPIGSGLLSSELEWSIIAAGQNIVFSPNPIANAAGTLLFNQTGAATTGSWFLTPQTVSNNINNGFPLFDYPNWKAVWVFGLGRTGFTGSGGSTPPVAFSTAQTSLYIGLGNWVNQTLGTSSPLRPPTFVGLRFDTDPVNPAQGSLQTKSANNSDVTTASLQVALPNPVSQGNLLVFCCRLSYNTVGSITDSAGNTWQKAFSQAVTNGGNTSSLELWYAENSNPGQITITANTSNAAAAFWQSVSAEYTGMGTNTLQQTAHTTGTSSSFDSGPITTTVANTLILGVACNETANNVSPTAGSGWTSENTSDGDLILESRTATSTLTVDATGTYNQSVIWGCGVAAFQSKAPLADTQFVFEALQNGTTGSYLTTKNRTQGNTFATGKVPAENTWYRLEILCTVAGQALVSLFDGVSTVSATLNMPKYTQGHSASLVLSQLNGIGTANITNVFFPYAGGSKITISGVTNSTYTSFNATWNVSQFFTIGSVPNFYKSGSNISQSGSIDGSITGYGGVYPYVAFGNDGTANPVASREALLIDFFGLAWNPGVGGGTGTPTTNKARYW